MREEHNNSFDIKIDINNAGDLRSLTIVCEGEIFSILLNEICVAQIERSQGNWHIRFSNISGKDLEKIQETIETHYSLNP